MGKIVAIGGGDFKSNGKINHFILELSEISSPKLLFIGTAMSDDPSYIRQASDYFSGLGCVTDTLSVMSETYDEEQIKEKILSSDIIYVGGGDTVLMMKEWRRQHVDRYLTEAYKKGIVLSGVSAGAICWFAFGHHEEDPAINTYWWDTERPYGLDLIHAIHCPHYNESGHETFDQKLAHESLKGVALENDTALVEKDGRYFIVKSDPDAKAYLIYYTDNGMQKIQLSEGEVFL